MKKALFQAMETRFSPVWDIPAIVFSHNAIRLASGWGFLLGISPASGRAAASGLACA